MQVAWVSLIPECRLPNEARRSKLARACRSNALKLQQTIEAHAKANRTCLKPVFEGVVLGLEVIPLFRLRSVPPGHNNVDNKNAKAQSSERNPYMIDEGCAQSNNMAWYLIVALGRVGPCLIRAMQWVERHDVDRTWTVHGEVQVMRHHKLIVFGQPAHQCHSLRITVEALVWLVWPGKEETARAPVLQAIQTRAVV